VWAGVRKVPTPDIGRGQRLHRFYQQLRTGWAAPGTAAVAAVDAVDGLPGTAAPR
jgi:hypothetical protein